MTQNAAELLTSYGGEIRPDYSGRGMYGKTTFGVVFDSQSDFFDALADNFSDFVEDGNRTDAQELCDALRSLRTDNMGTSIIYY